MLDGVSEMAGSIGDADPDPESKAAAKGQLSHNKQFVHFQYGRHLLSRRSSCCQDRLGHRLYHLFDKQQLVV